MMTNNNGNRLLNHQICTLPVWSDWAQPDSFILYWRIQGNPGALGSINSRERPSWRTKSPEVLLGYKERGIMMADRRRDLTLLVQRWASHPRHCFLLTYILHGTKKWSWYGWQTSHTKAQHDCLTYKVRSLRWSGPASNAQGHSQMIYSTDSLYRIKQSIPFQHLSLFI